MDSPGKAVMAVVLTIVGIMLFVGVLIGGRELGWWLKADSVNRQVKIDNTQTGTQQGWYDQVQKDIRDAAVLPDGPQKAAVVTDACKLIPRLTETYQTSDVVAFQQENC